MVVTHVSVRALPSRHSAIPRSADVVRRVASDAGGQRLSGLSGPCARDGLHNGFYNSVPFSLNVNDPPTILTLIIRSQIVANTNDCDTLITCVLQTPFSYKIKYHVKVLLLFQTLIAVNVIA